MKKKIKYFVFITTILILTILFIPFTNVPYNSEGKYQYCRYRLSVYEFWYIESEGEGYGKSDTYIGNIILKKKIGGPLEYFGIKKIKKQ